MCQTKVLVVRKDQRTPGERFRVDIQEIEEVDKFKYLRLMINGNGGMGEKVCHMLLIGRKKIWRALDRFWKWTRVSINIKRALYEKVVLPIVMYAPGTIMLHKGNWQTERLFNIIIKEEVTSLS